ncbi:MAG: amidase [Alphaproteobacteria bacterium]|nr:amidase [Alphaproteobacteria bacterium]MDE2110346.1 amidase [Alphaproteobacteria bacterium]MDE2494885.1 amidase [Alphaproteobacteria bacterium]
MSFSEYTRTDGLGLAELVAGKAVTPGELLEEAIARAERLNPALNAVVFKDYERAWEITKGDLPKGLFTGVPFLLKDIFLNAQGTPTRQGARFFPAFPATHDSYLMTRFRKAGLVPFGKTNVPEFGLVPTTEGKLYGAAHNPWHLEHSTGGSSGGAAAAVAAGIVPLAHANDGGGSIRIPASCCGLVGLKPSRGRVSAGPDAGEAMDGLAIDLVVSRSVRDTAAALDIANGSEPGDPYTAPSAPTSYLQASKEKPKRLRIAFTMKNAGGAALHPDCVAAVQRAAKLCADLGHVVEEAAPDLDQSALVPTFMVIWCGNLASVVDLIARLTGQTPSPDNLEGLTFGLYQQGKNVTASDYLQAKMMFNHVARAAAKFHQTYDLWLTPTLGSPPVKLGVLDMEERDPQKAFAPLIDYVPYTAIQNVTGQPAINLPLHWNDEGLPVGVQFVAPYGDELTLLRLAMQLEQSAPWFARYAAIKV